MTERQSLREITEKMHPLTRPTFANWGRIMFYPTGVTDFTTAVAKDLNLTESMTGEFLKNSGTWGDICKNLLYGWATGLVIYKTCIEGVLN